MSAKTKYSRLLAGPYLPRHEENRMSCEGDVAIARKRFLTHPSNNLTFLLEQRYGWMNDYIRGGDLVVELGAGAGFSRSFIHSGRLLLTDIHRHEWIDQTVDALDPPFDDESVDAFICSHMIHHLACPLEFFRIIRSKLRVGGVCLIQEINTALLMRALLRLMRHEGWSYEVDVFDPSRPANDPDDPWSANCAIPEMLFSDPDRFQEKVVGMEVIHNRLNECFIFALSGGVIARTWTIELPVFMLRLIGLLDRGLIALAPELFALGRSVVLRRVD